MKKLLALLALLLLLLPGCGKTEEPRDAFLDTFLLTDMKVDGIDTPALFNPAKGTTTPICSDPLCSHTKKDGCPFAGYHSLQELHYYGGAVWFQSAEGGKLMDSDIMRYDLDTGRVTKLTSLPELREMVPDSIPIENGQSYGFFEGCFVYRVPRADHTIAFQLRVSLDDGKIEVLDHDFIIPFAQYKKKSLSYTPELSYTGVSFGIEVREGDHRETILSEKRIAICFTDLLESGKLIYVDSPKREDGSYDFDRMAVHVYDMESGEDRLIIDDFPSAYIALIGDFIYYSRYVEDPPSLGYDKNMGKEQFNLSGGILFRTSIETGEESVAFELPAYTLIQTEIHRIGQYVVIEYRNTDYSHWEEEATPYGVWYAYEKENGRVVYDTASGETKAYPEASQ